MEDLCIALSQSSERVRGVFSHFSGPFSGLLEPGASLDEGSECAQRDFPLLSYIALPLTYTGPANCGEVSPSLWHITSVCLVKCHDKTLASRVRLTVWLLVILIHPISPQMVTVSLWKVWLVYPSQLLCHSNNIKSSCGFFSRKFITFWYLVYFCFLSFHIGLKSLLWSFLYFQH